MTHSAPAIGQIVHYVSYGTPGGEYTRQCRAAIITAVPEVELPVILPEGIATQVDLAVFNPTGMFFNRCHQDEETKQGGSWHWPEQG